MGDRLGKLALTDTGIFRREMQVLSTVGLTYVDVFSEATIHLDVSLL